MCFSVYCFAENRFKNERYLKENERDICIFHFFFVILRAEFKLIEQSFFVCNSTKTAASKLTNN